MLNGSPGALKSRASGQVLRDRGLNVCPPFFLCQKLRGD
ncbi:hypothetical protein B425_0681 [Bacillus amyloliquefaciens]|nr:hypothetical protein LL3_00673 [Bacillus amyloliquefaciens LL3]KYC94148.1 hypothetical protein B425_0681 [Bacillus amyloliquefaciens]